MRPDAAAVNEQGASAFSMKSGLRWGPAAMSHGHRSEPTDNDTPARFCVERPRRSETEPIMSQRPAPRGRIEEAPSRPGSADAAAASRSTSLRGDSRAWQKR